MGLAAAPPRTQPASEERRGAVAARPGVLALGGLCLLYVALAALPAAAGSKLVLATVGGSPGWLLGPLRFAGLSAADGARWPGRCSTPGCGWRWLLYVAVLVRARDLPARSVLWVIAGLHLLFLLAPPLLSQDVFSYIAYARLGVEHSLNPYTHSPLDIPGDPVFAFAGSKDAVSVYGPLFTLLTYALAPLGVAGAFWVLKGVAAACSFGVVVLVWKGAKALGRDPVVPALLVGLNPLMLVHVVGGAHNEALVMLLVVGGIAGGRTRVARSRGLGSPRRGPASRRRPGWWCRSSCWGSRALAAVAARGDRGARRDRADRTGGVRHARARRAQLPQLEPAAQLALELPLQDRAAARGGPAR